ncbi:fatty acid desaturase [soil metagenome]
MNAERLRKNLARFRTPSSARAAGEIAITLFPLAGCWALTFLCAQNLPGLLVLVWPLTSLFLVRTFLIQHDCGHHGFFPSARLNDAVGRMLGILTFTPYEYWRRGHAMHHAYSGNLDRRGFWDVPMVTVEEYRALGPFRRWGLRLVRHPVVLFGFVPFYLFVIQQRLPIGLMRQGWRPWASALGTNAMLAALLTLVVSAFGLFVTVVAMLPILAMTASIGVWLFFVQHYFGASHFRREEHWNFADAALHGSSLYRLPQPLMWFTANIGIHHIHHLDSRIPYYRLPNAISAYPELEGVGCLPVLASGFCVSRILWDESRAGFVTPPLPSGSD